jgi:hypothetical protein
MPVIFPALKLDGKLEVNSGKSSETLSQKQNINKKVWLKQ